MHVNSGSLQALGIDVNCSLTGDGSNLGADLGWATAGGGGTIFMVGDCAWDFSGKAPAPGAPATDAHTGGQTGSPTGPEDPDGCGGGGGGPPPAPKSGPPYRRPYVQQWVKDEVAENIDFTEDDLMIDPNSRIPFAGTPDLGHAPGFEFWKMAELAKQNGLTQQEFNEMMQDPEFYQYESPSSNRSRCYEAP